MRVAVHHCIDSLDGHLADWRALAAGLPFRSPEWLLGWWRHYYALHGIQRELFVVVVHNDDDRPVLICPWYLESSHPRKRMVRWLGDQDICTDHQSLIGSATRTAVAQVAEFLHRTGAEWDLIELGGIDQGDDACLLLAEELRKHRIHHWWRSVGNTWEIALPATWDAYVAQLSKSHRKQIRHLCDRVLDTDRCRWHSVETRDQLETGWPVLVDLHQRRQRSLGRPGCFSRPEFAAFHRELASALLQSRQVRLGWLELDGEPVAAEYHFVGDQKVFVYQGGIQPARLKSQPGALASIVTIREAIARGDRIVDFLRGDEPYKSHWRANPKVQARLEIVPHRVGAEVRAVAVEMIRDVWHVIGHSFGPR